MLIFKLCVCRRKTPRGFPPLKATLKQCPACAAFLKKLARLEEQLARLTPPTAVISPQQRLNQIVTRLEPAALSEPSAPISPLLRFRRFDKDRGRKKLALAVALVAFLLTMAGGLSFWPKPVDRETLAGLRAERDSVLKRSKGSAAKLESLFRLAKESEREARDLASRGDVRRLALLASFHQELLGKDLDRALANSFDISRDRLTDFTQDRSRAESDFQRLAAQHADQPEVLQSLELIAQASKAAEQKLRQAMAG